MSRVPPRAGLLAKLHVPNRPPSQHDLAHDIFLRDESPVILERGRHAEAVDAHHLDAKCHDQNGLHDGRGERPDVFGNGTGTSGEHLPARIDHTSDNYRFVRPGAPLQESRGASLPIGISIHDDVGCSVVPP